MEIIEEEKVLSRDIQRGDIINNNGNFLMVTNVVDEDGDTFVVYLKTGALETENIEELTSFVNNPEENVSLVSDSKLYIEGYM